MTATYAPLQSGGSRGAVGGRETPLPLAVGAIDKRLNGILQHIPSSVPLR
jgi:hypothetical protein